jgi:hypothetical protein
VFATPFPPQIWPLGHDPHWSVFPHPSPMAPQVAPALTHVAGLQAVPPPDPPAPPVAPKPP